MNVNKSFLKPGQQVVVASFALARAGRSLKQKIALVDQLTSGPASLADLRHVETLDAGAGKEALALTFVVSGADAVAQVQAALPELNGVCLLTVLLA